MFVSKSNTFVAALDFGTALYARVRKSLLALVVLSRFSLTPRRRQSSKYDRPRADKRLCYDQSRWDDHLRSLRLFCEQRGFGIQARTKHEFGIWTFTIAWCGKIHAEQTRIQAKPTWRTQETDGICQASRRHRDSGIYGRYISKYYPSFRLVDFPSSTD